MPIHIHATNRVGAVHPDQTFGLPDRTEAQVIIVPVTASTDQPAEGQPDIATTLPQAPRFTSQELRERLAKYAVRVGSLPPDFSREDICSDHD